MEKIDVEELLKNRSISSSLLLRRVVKPRLLFVASDYSPIWFYVGVRDHIVVPKTYCTCMSFVVNVMSKKERPICRHLLIQHVSELKKLYREIEINNREELAKIVDEILNFDVSPTIRRLIFKR